MLFTGGKAKIDGRLRKRILLRLNRLNVAERGAEMDLPGFDFHTLRGFRPTRYSVHVNGPWCITFEFLDGQAFQLDLEQYHQESATMPTYKAVADPNRCPSHPGALLDDIIAPTGMSRAEIAARLGISRQHLYDLIGERKPVSANVAVRLGKLFGDGAGVWLRMQAAHDAWHVERDVDVSHIETIRSA